MKKVLLQFILLLCLPVSLLAQQLCYLTSEITNTQQKCTYTFTTLNNESHYVTDYVIKDEAGKPLKLIKLTNKKLSRIIELTIREVNTGKTEHSYTYNYSDEAGLIINELTDSVIELIKPYEYLYLFSFENGSKEYLNLHFVKKINSYSILFDAINDELLEKNKQYFKQLVLYKKQVAEKKAKEEQMKELYSLVDSISEIKVAEVLKEMGIDKNNVNAIKQQNDNNTLVPEKKLDFNSNLLKDAKDFYQEYKADSLFIVEQKNKINYFIQSGDYMGSKLSLLSTGYGRYAGEKGPMGVPEGDGLLIQGSNLYFGKFTKGVFKSGFAIIRANGSEYAGEYSNGAYNGRGWLKNSAGYFLGIFIDGSLKAGTTYSTVFEKYFGRMVNGKRTGYGELTTKKEDRSYGVFSNGVFIKGYLLKADYMMSNKVSKIENGSSDYVGITETNSFFDPLKEVKK